MQNIAQLPMPTERLLIIEKRSSLLWEAKGVTNPGVVRLSDNSIAMVYRGCGSDNIGYLGFCRLDPEGKQVIRGSRRSKPLNGRSALERKEFPDGCGDPRINQVGGWYYIWANGRNNAQMAQNRQQFDNNFAKQYIGGRQTVAFRTKDFKKLTYLGLHGPDEFDKNSFLHPGAIGIEGKPYWAFFHRVQYSIQVLLTPSVSYLKERSIWKDHMKNLKAFTLLKPEFDWEGISLENDWPGSIAGGTPPIAIDNAVMPSALNPSRKYWLHFYNASGQPRKGTIARDRRVGAIIYTIKHNPTLGSQPFEVIARTPEPILRPQASYELAGPNGDVVFATGAVATLDGKAIDVFYGSGDVAISKARFDLRELLDYICQFNEHGLRQKID